MSADEGKLRMSTNARENGPVSAHETVTHALSQVHLTGGGNRYISFSLGKEEYAIPLLDVREVIAVPETTPVPFTPPHFMGIMNLRGQVISVIDLRTKLGIKPVAGPETAVIICDIGNTCLGVLVDSINSVVSPDEGQLSSKPEIESQKSTDYISAVYRKTDRLVLIIDLKKALNGEDRKAISTAATPKKAA